MTTTTNLVPLDVGLKEKFQKLIRSLKTKYHRFSSRGVSDS